MRCEFESLTALMLLWGQFFVILDELRKHSNFTHLVAELYKSTLVWSLTKLRSSGKFCFSVGRTAASWSHSIYFKFVTLLQKFICIFNRPVVYEAGTVLAATDGKKSTKQVNNVTSRKILTETRRKDEAKLKARTIIQIKQQQRYFLRSAIFYFGHSYPCVSVLNMFFTIK